MLVDTTPKRLVPAFAELSDSIQASAPVAAVNNYRNIPRLLSVEGHAQLSSFARANRATSVIKAGYNTRVRFSRCFRRPVYRA